MNLSGIFNLPDLSRTQDTGQAQSPHSTQAGANVSTSSAAPNGGKTDQASLSASGLAAAQSATPEASDVRMEKVASVNAAIQAGTYNVSASDVADKIMQGMFDPNQR